MDATDRRVLAAPPGIAALAAAVAAAGSSNGHHAGPYPVFAICALIAFAVNWIAFVPSFAARTERYYDLTGSLTYLCVTACALTLVGRYDPRSILLACLVTVWAFRLGSFLFARIRREGKDARFDEIKTSGPRFFLAWTLQGLWVLLTLAAALAAITTVQPKPLGAIAFAGLIVWSAGFAIESVADRQKTKFRADPANRDRFIATGLWAWSRHPNYFGEIVLWSGVALIALPALSGWQHLTLISPVFVYVLLTRVSGIPMLEARSDVRWGDSPEYRAYCETTPVLVPKRPAKVLSKQEGEVR